MNFVALLHQILYSPERWASFAAGEFREFYQRVVRASGSNLTLATRSISIPPELKQRSDPDYDHYTFHAITCGDSIDQDTITTQVVFDELSRVVKEVSPMCKCPRYDQSLATTLLIDYF